MKPYDEEFIQKLLSEPNPNEVLNIFNNYSKNYSKCILVHFSLYKNDSYKIAEDFNINKYCAYGLADYTKAYFLDNSKDASLHRNVLVGRTINLDINIITYLNSLINKKNIEDESDFIEYLRKIKDDKINLNMSTALIERASTLYDKTGKWENIVLSYVKYETLKNITKETLIKDIVLPEEKYQWAKKMIDVSKEFKQQLIYKEILCIQSLVMKAFLLKLNKIKEEEKIEKLVNFCINELNFYMENELYLLSLYLKDDEKVKRTFEKIQGVSKDTLKRIKNTCWDIAQIRLAELQMKNDLKENTIIFHYVGTKDVGLKDIIKINPIILIGVLDEEPIVVRKHNITDIFDIDKFSSIANNRIKKKTTLDDVEKINKKLEKKIDLL